jgi:hypothetical protein
MLGVSRRLVFGTALALLTLASAGFARASIVALDAVAGTQLDASAIPAQLGPINELGRNGWHCEPEQGAKARVAHEATLPASDGY